MESIQHVMAHDHKRCDAIFAKAEFCASKNDWDQAQELAIGFINALLFHFKHEEETLFPAFEDKTGMTQGPTMMMRHEHEQMRELTDELKKAAENKNQDRYLGISETLLIFMQQHNMKEEQMLYPMIDKECGEDATNLTENIRSNAEQQAA
jgi:hemerythrin-like domain-containing protein